MNSKSSKQVIIRGLTEFETATLKEYAAGSNYDSVNAFLLALIREELSEQMALMM